jgi:acyl-CoA thioester hydrolase
VQYRVLFADVDAMGIVWHGRYAALFEAASTEARRLCGLTYDAFRTEEIAAPIVQLHVDYHRPLVLDELVTVHAAIVWSEAARLDTQYVVDGADGQLAVTGYTVQMLTSARTGLPWLVRPPLLERALEAARRTR